MSINGYTIKTKIGSGLQGAVFKVLHEKSQKEYALKKVPCDHTESANLQLKEFQLLQKLQHPNVCFYQDVFIHIDEDQLFVCIVMPLYNSGDLFNYVADKNFSQEEMVDITIQIASSLQYIHENKIAHRDLKLNNILLHKDENSKLTAVLGDFGFSTLQEKSLKNTICGTLVRFFI